MAELRVCIDVDDLERAIAFYTRALDLRVGRRFDDRWAELLGANASIDLLANAPGTEATRCAHAVRDYARHWTPVHLDFVVDDLDAAVARARDAGATVEREPRQQPWGRIALLADPFGHGLCLLQLEGRGYDAIAQPRPRPHPLRGGR